MREKEEITKGMGGGVCVTDVSWSGLRRWDPDSLVFHTKTDSGILAHTTSKVNLSK